MGIPSYCSASWRWCISYISAKGHPIQELSGAIYPSLLQKAIEDGLAHGEKCEKKTTWFDPSYG